MGDLSTISAADPANAEASGQGASRIRTLIDALLTSFGVEHALAGPHKFKLGDGTYPGLPGLPAVGNAGRVFLDTTHGRMLRDTGTSWVLLQTLTRLFTFNTGELSIGGSFTTIRTLSINVPTNGWLVVIAGAQYISSVGGALSLRLQVGGATLDPGNQTHPVDTSAIGRYIYTFGVDASGTTGTRVVNLDGQMASGTCNATIRQMLAFVI